MSDEKDFQALLDDYDIQFFAGWELPSREVQGGPKVVYPPRPMWEHIIPTVAIADRIRSRLGAPVSVISGYRTPAYNLLVGGATQSVHLEFRALDLTTRHAPLKDLLRIANEEMEHAHARKIPTGRGYYDTFVHIDTHSVRGGRRRWDRRWK